MIYTDNTVVSTRLRSAGHAARAEKQKICIAQFWLGNLQETGYFEDGGDTLSIFIVADSTEYVTNIPTNKMGKRSANVGLGDGRGLLQGTTPSLRSYRGSNPGGLVSQTR